MFRVFARGFHFTRPCPFHPRFSMAGADPGRCAAGEDVPDGMTCPITGYLINEAVLGSDGYTYERLAIEAWLLGALGTFSPSFPRLSPHLPRVALAQAESRGCRQ